MPQTLPSTNVRNDGYVGILIFTCLVFALGIFLMYQENEEYGFDNAPKSAAPNKVSTLLKAPKADPAVPPAPVPPAPKVGFVPPPLPTPVAAAPTPPVAPPTPVAEVAPQPKPAEAVAKPEPKPAEPPLVQPGFVLPRRK